MWPRLMRVGHAGVAGAKKVGLQTSMFALQPRDSDHRFSIEFRASVRLDARFCE